VTVRIALLPGDGVGPEVAASAARVLRWVLEAEGHAVSMARYPIGGAALSLGRPALPDETLEAAGAADAVLLGAIGDSRFDHLPPAERPESALLSLRRALGLFANLRPARAWKSLEDAGPLRPAVLDGTDLLVVRELTGGLYYGTPRGLDADGGGAVNTMRYSRDEIARIGRVAFERARRRRRHVVSVDKANVLEVSQLWRTVVTGLAAGYPDVTLRHEYVDAAAMKLALAPSSFDVILTENLFGDILSDEAGAICGSIGLLPSASLGSGPGLFEPVHGAAPDLAGRDIANPVGAIASAAMLLDDGLGLREAAARVEAALEAVLAAGIRTADIAAPGRPPAGTRAFTDAVMAALDAHDRDPDDG
jgi:3-isopropylmalate dehydrogenase